MEIFLKYVKHSFLKVISPEYSLEGQDLPPETLIPVAWGGALHRPCLKAPPGTSLAVQWLRLCASTTGDTGLIPCQGTKIPHSVQ